MTILDNCEREYLDSIDALKGRRGFVLAPFGINGKHKIQLFTTSDIRIVPIPEAKDNHLDILLTKNNKETYERAFDTFITHLQQSEVKKLVLSRKEEYATKLSKEDMENLFFRACKAYPRLMIYLIHNEEDDSWFGCTPEILVDGEKSHFRTVALAGTMKAPKDNTLIIWSNKNQHEQRIVADYIRTKLQPHCEVIEEEGPYTSRAGNLIHLKTEFHFTPNDHTPITSIIANLHPTPAVCGLPKEESLTFINENEGYDREYYAGIVGWHSSLYVNLRCCKYANNKLTLFAGGGILPESDKQSEWKETEAKMQTILSLLQPN